MAPQRSPDRTGTGETSGLNRAHLGRGRAHLVQSDRHSAQFVPRCARKTPRCERTRLPAKRSGLPRPRSAYLRRTRRRSRAAEQRSRTHSSALRPCATKPEVVVEAADRQQNFRGSPDPSRALHLAFRTALTIERSQRDPARRSPARGRICVPVDGGGVSKVCAREPAASGGALADHRRVHAHARPDA